MAQFVLNALTLSNINRFSKFFHCQNQEELKFVITLSLKILPHLKCVATLLCEMSESRGFGWRVKNGEDWHRLLQAKSQG